MEKKKIKIAVIVLIIIVIYSGFVIFLSNQNMPVEDPNENPPSVGGDNPIVDSSYTYLLIDNTDIWRYQGKGWYNSKNINDEERYSTYINNSYYGDYYLKFIKVWNLFDVNNNYVYYSGNFLAHSKDLKVDIQNFSSVELTSYDFNTINKILNTSFDTNTLLNKEKIITDVDSNGINDIIVYVSNIDVADEYDEYFNLIYLILNNDGVSILLNDKSTAYNMLSQPIYSLNYILKIDNNKYSNLIFKKGYFSEVDEPSNVMFEYINGKYIKVIEK